MAERQLTEPVLKVEGVEAYYGAIRAIDRVSLVVGKGRIVTLLGANGAGKTSVLRTISGIVRARSGRIVFEGREIQSLRPEQIVAAGISHVPEGREIFPYLTVRENIMVGAFAQPDAAAKGRDAEMVVEYFPALADKLNRRAGTLSGGEQQMLAIGRALMARPKLMLFDEPSLGLSPKLVGQIFEIIRRINAERQIAILLVEQNTKVALDVAHDGYVLEMGRVVMQGTAERLRQSEDVRKYYLGMAVEDTAEAG